MSLTAWNRGISHLNLRCCAYNKAEMWILLLKIFGNKGNMYTIYIVQSICVQSILHETLKLIFMFSRNAHVHANTLCLESLET